MPPSTALRRAGWGLTAALLLLPALAMLISDQVNLGPGDFLAAALLLGVAGLSVELTGRLPKRARLPDALAVITALLLAWAELAVGIVGPS
jgi:hypothetical protein